MSVIIKHTILFVLFNYFSLSIAVLVFIRKYVRYHMYFALQLMPCFEPKLTPSKGSLLLQANC